MQATQWTKKTLCYFCFEEEEEEEEEEEVHSHNSQKYINY